MSTATMTSTSVFERPRGSGGGAGGGGGCSPAATIPSLPNRNDYRGHLWHGINRHPWTRLELLFRKPLDGGSRRPRRCGRAACRELPRRRKGSARRPTTRRSVQGAGLLRGLGHANPAALACQVLEIRDWIERNLRRNHPMLFDATLQKPLRGDGRRHARVDDASAELPRLVRPRDRLVPQGHRMAVLLADQDASLDIDVQLRLLRLREVVDDRRCHVVRPHLVALHLDRLAACEPEPPQSRDCLAEPGRG